MAAMSSPCIPAFWVLCALLASASHEGHSGVKTATEVSKGTERLPIEERMESGTPAFREEGCGQGSESWRGCVLSSL